MSVVAPDCRAVAEEDLCCADCADDQRLSSCPRRAVDGSGFCEEHRQALAVRAEPTRGDAR